MNNLHRKLAPISEGAWAQIEQEAQRTLKRYLAARRVVGVDGPGGFDLAAVGTGHTKDIPSFRDGLRVAQRIVRPLIELRVPFELTRKAIDDVERGSNDSDWQPLKDAARTMAFSEDHVVFEGYHEAGIDGISQTTSNTRVKLPQDVAGYPDVVATAVERLRMAGVNGPYALVLGAEPYTKITGGSDDGYPVLKHIRGLVDDEVIWCPAIDGGVVLTTRGGDFDLTIGQDLSIGYLGHSDDVVRLYFQETMTFMSQTAEASVVLEPAGSAR